VVQLATVELAVLFAALAVWDDASSLMSMAERHECQSTSGSHSDVKPVLLLSVTGPGQLLAQRSQKTGRG
jgi:hypothetical protein